jgi:hypothetical protein
MGKDSGLPDFRGTKDSGTTILRIKENSISISALTLNF